MNPEWERLGVHAQIALSVHAAHRYDGVVGVALGWRFLADVPSQGLVRLDRRAAIFDKGF